jgi:hypothetical protein
MKLHSRALFDLDEDRVYPVDSAVLLQSKLGVTVIKSLAPPCRGIWASDIPIVQKIDEDEMCSYIALTQKAAKHSQFAERAVMLAWFTGHRAGAIRQLRWSDIDLDAGSILWRAETDKVGYEHRNPLHQELVTFLKRERARTGAIGAALLFPSETNPAQPCSREYFVKKLWTELRDAAGIPSGKRYGWRGAGSLMTRSVSASCSRACRRRRRSTNQPRCAEFVRSCCGQLRCRTYERSRIRHLSRLPSWVAGVLRSS